MGACISSASDKVVIPRQRVKGLFSPVDIHHVESRKTEVEKKADERRVNAVKEAFDL
jgi:hypothetical protein